MLVSSPRKKECIRTLSFNHYIDMLDLSIMNLVTSDLISPATYSGYEIIKLRVVGKGNIVPGGNRNSIRVGVINPHKGFLLQKHLIHDLILLLWINGKGIR
ncbi:hypothetical protein B0G93_1248 [Bacillus sp. V-88]|nr:hypothetical protein B0G93_1248 [Bacillus sp. V-88]SLK24389.1 hypothetical protein SAMN06295884_1248 [Bacillus sp. V-88]